LFFVGLTRAQDRLYVSHARRRFRHGSEREMAAQFEVSRNMVREALRMLETSGMVELRPGALGGAFIARGRTDFVARSLSDMISVGGFTLSDLLEARRALSGIIVPLAASRATTDDLSALTSNVETAHRLVHDEAWRDIAVLNIEFHNLLAKATANPVLGMLQQSIMAVMADVSETIGPIRSDMTIRSRLRFLELLREQRVDEAAAEMDGNLRRVHTYFMEHSAGTKYAEHERSADRP